MYETFNFNKKVLGYKCYSPESWDETGNGVVFTIKTKNVDYRVFVPWSNIAYRINSKKYTGKI